MNRMNANKMPIGKSWNQCGFAAINRCIVWPKFGSNKASRCGMSLAGCGLISKPYASKKTASPI